MRDQHDPAVEPEDGRSIDVRESLEDLFDRTSVGLLFLDRDQRVVRVNDAVLRMTGLARDAHLGRTPDELATRVWPDLTPYQQSVLETGQPIVDLEVRAETEAAPGTFRRFLVSYYPVAGRERPAGICAVVTETGEQSPSARALRVRERQQAAIAMLGMRALETSDLQLVMDEAVELLAAGLQVEYAKVLESNFDAQALRVRAGVGWKPGVVGNALVPAGPSSQAGYTLLSRGPVIVADLADEPRFRGAPLLFEHGVVSGMTVVIHGRARAYGVLGAHTKQRRRFSPDDVNFLQSLAHVLAAAIERERLRGELIAAEALRQSDELKSALLRAVSHDVRSPLTTIVAAAEVLESRSGDPVARENAAAIVSESSRLNDLFDKLLDVSRLHAGAAKPRREWCSIEEILEATLEAYDADGSGFRMRLVGELPLVCADAAQLERSFGNLFENAKRFSEGQPVEVRASVSDGKLLVQVSDRGPGVPAVDRERVFEPFFRRDPGGQRHNGSGLGLAIARGFVEANGGSLWVDSNGDGGATFSVELPINAVAT